MKPPSVFSLQNFDLQIVKGDSFNTVYEAFDEGGAPIDIRPYGIRFTLKDPITEAIVEMTAGQTTFSKERNDNINGGGGLYCRDDAQLALLGAQASLAETNQLLLLLKFQETKLLTPLAYDYDIEFSYGVNLSKFTFVRGKLLVLPEATVS